MRLFIAENRAGAGRSGGGGYEGSQLGGNCTNDRLCTASELTSGKRLARCIKVLHSTT